MANYELGRSRPPDDVIQRIADRLGLPKDHLDSGPELTDLAEEFERMRGDTASFTEDEQALIRLVRVLNSDDVIEVVRSAVQGIGPKAHLMKIADPVALVKDVARFILILEGKASFERGLEPGRLLRLATLLAARVGGDG